MKTLQEKIEELESQGWIYDNDFRVATHVPNTMVQLTVLKKGNYYRSISKGKINAPKKIMSDEEYEQYTSF